MAFSNGDQFMIWMILILIGTGSTVYAGQMCSNFSSSVTKMDVIRVLGLLGWSTVTVIYDSNSENQIEHLVLNSGIQLQGIRFLRFKYNVNTDPADLDTLLYSVHGQLFPHLNFIVFGEKQFVTSVISSASSLDDKSRRSTDYRHSSRWLTVTNVTDALLENLRHIVDGQLDHVAVMCAHSEEWINRLSYQMNPRSSNDISLVTWSMTVSPPRFAMVTVTSSCNDTTFILDHLFPNVKYGYNRRTFIVSTLMYAPFTMSRVEGNETIYEGFCFEVLDLIARALNFSVKIVSPADGEWGLIANNSWTGLVGQLANREVDMVVAPLSMHEDRAEVMDFILPAFHTENVDILFRRKEVSNGALFTLLEPYKYHVLICIVCSVVFVVVVIFFLEKWVMFEIKRAEQRPRLEQRRKSRRSVKKLLWPRREIADHTYLIFWRIIGTIFRQGASWEPVAVSTRVLVSGWWLLTLLLSAGYSAYLVASLAVHINPRQFTTLQDAVDSTEYKLGVMSTGIIKLIFEKSRRPDIKQAWTKILKLNQTDPNVLAGTEHEHLQKVLEGHYCWIVDVTTAEKSLRHDCELDTVGVRLIDQQLAIGVPTNSPLKLALEAAMSSIADSGLLGKWWRRWQKTRTSEMCPMPPSNHPISFEVFLGPLCVAGAGIVIAAFVLVGENVRSWISRHYDSKSLDTSR